MRDFNESYTIRDFVDKNKWSNVYIGINNETKQNIILNMLINIDGNEGKIEKFKGEVNLLKNIDNTNLVSINNMYTENNKGKMTYFIESENFEGLTLKELKEVSEITKIQSLQMIREVLNGILELNNIGFNFESLSEDDIIVNNEGIVKVNTLNFINNHQGHINCEEVLNSRFQKNSDVFVVGSILCELLTNKKDFNTKDDNLDLDENLKEILEKCTNKKHKLIHKYEDVEDFSNDIISYLERGIISSKAIIDLEQLKGIKSKLKPKNNKYIAICSTVILVLCTSAFGIKHFLDNRKTENQVSATETAIDDYENKTEEKTQTMTPTVNKYNSSNTVKPTNKSEEITNEKDNNTNTENNKDNEEDNTNSDKDNTNPPDIDNNNSDNNNNKDDNNNNANDDNQDQNDDEEPTEEPDNSDNEDENNQDSEDSKEDQDDNDENQNTDNENNQENSEENNSLQEDDDTKENSSNDNSNVNDLL